MTASGPDGPHRPDRPYRPRAAPADLADTLVCRWDATLSGAMLMVPDGCLELMWLEGRGLLVCGPETVGWPAAHARPIEGSGLRFRPGRAAPVLRLPLSELRDRRVALVDLLPRPVVERAEQRLHALPATRRSDALVELTRLLSAGSDARHGSRVSMAGPPPAVQGLIERSDGLAPLADRLGVTPRQLHRRSLEAFGYGPAVLRRILRVQRFLALHKAHPALRLAELAAGAGYADQAHLSRDVRLLCGLTPRGLLASRSADWHGDGAVVRV